MADTVIEISPSGPVIVEVTENPKVIHAESVPKMVVVQPSNRQPVNVTVAAGLRGPQGEPGPPGEKGDHGRGFTPRGHYSDLPDGTPLNADDLVEISGSTYRIKYSITKGGPDDQSWAPYEIWAARGGPGPAPNLDIGSVTTGAAGTNAEASITGEAPNFELSLTIPRGDTGSGGGGDVSSVNGKTGTVVLNAGDVGAVSKSGDTVSGDLTLTNAFYALKTTNSDLVNKTYRADPFLMAQDPFGGLYHDILAFGRHVGAPTYETSPDGVAWTASAADMGLFSMLENRDSLVIDPATPVRYARWTWNSPNFQFSEAQWLLIAHAYGGTPDPSKQVILESSANGVAWTQRHVSTYSDQAMPMWHYSTNIGGDAWVRLTIRHLSGAKIALSSIRFLSRRWGNQGGGKELEYPYTWDKDRKVGFVRATSDNGPAAANELTRKDYVDSMGSINSDPNTVVRRDGAGTASFVSASATQPPSQVYHLTRKDYVDGGLSGKANSSHTHTASNISDSTTVGRSVLTAADATAARTAIGAGTSNLAIGTTGTTASAGNHTHTAANITDSTVTGRSVLTAADATAARTAIGAGTSNLAIGSTGTTAAAGNHTHTAANITDSTATGRSVLTAADVAAARTAIGLGNVDNTSDANKPISTATQAALNAKVIADGITTVKKITQAAYDALGSKDASTLYVIVG